VIIVLGSQNSSNSQRLRELAAERGQPSFLVDGPQDLSVDFFQKGQTVLITAGASAPESVVRETVDWLIEHFDATIETRTIREEKVQFPLPKPLRGLSIIASES
jgi:4-hydroxy-3-methylbut-2-enyl diphosphate reductase